MRNRLWKRICTMSVLCAVSLTGVFGTTKVFAEESDVFVYEEVAETPENTEEPIEEPSEVPSEEPSQMPSVQPAAIVTFVYDKNGGTGSMKNTQAKAGDTVKLSKNTLKRKGHQFQNWNTKKDGTGTKYANGADMTKFAKKISKNTTVKLYAQWKPNKPSIAKVAVSDTVKIKVSYAKDTTIAGYQVQCADNKSFKKAKTFSAKKGSTSVVIPEKKAGAANYVRIRTYDKVGSKKIYSDWSKYKSVKMPKAYTVYNTKAETAIEADITLNGSGSGYHAKLVLVTPTSGVSFGIQYDRHAVAPYTGKAMALIENVKHNGAGGQQYTRPGNKSLKVGKKYHMMITIDKKGNGDVYLDYQKIGSYSNPNLASSKGNMVYIRCEGAARLNGDKVDAKFENIHVTRGYKDTPGNTYATFQPASCKTIKCNVDKKGDVRIKGTVTGIHGDWDSDYEKVSGIIQYQ